MNIKKYGKISSGTPNPVDWQVVDDGTGLLTGTARFFYSNNDGNVIKHGLPKKGDKHPFDDRLICKDVHSKYQTNEITYVDANYIGIDADPSGIVWELLCPTSDEPIDTHPDFYTWGILNTNPKKSATGPTPPKYNALTGRVDWNQNQVKLTQDWTFDKFKDTKENRGETASYNLVGVKNYKVPHATFRLTFSTKNEKIKNDSITALGKQCAKPPYGPDWLMSPTRSWLFTNLSITEYAGIYKIQTEFTLSGQEGTWNRRIYPIFGQV